jgi:hypothetical protein
MTKFNRLSTAIEFRFNCISPSKWSLINGCDGLIWMVTNREASKLVRQGYEVIA